MEHDPDSLGIYVHWPFCQAKCPYCDFNSHVARQIDDARWANAYRSELRATRSFIGPRQVSTVFFGGGTPSLMTPRLVGEVLAEIARLWSLAPDLEVSLEANPTSVERGNFRSLRDSGVNRISVGVQSLRDDALRRLGRTHNAAEARSALDVARAFFPRASFDLIYARQGQTLDEWRAELVEALDIGFTHLSLYQLTIEPGTVFGDLARRGRLRSLPDEDLSAEMYELTQDLCEAHGLPAYEVSNHAAPGEACRHNQRYWNGLDVAGIGPGAHGRVTRAGRRFAERSRPEPSEWLRTVEREGSAVERHEQSREEIADERLMMGLRAREGISMRDYERTSGRTLRPETLRDLGALGLVSIHGDQMSVTRQGRLLLNRVILALSE